MLYLSAEQFMYRFVQALKEKTVMDFKEMFRTVHLLMVDDVHFIAGKDSTQEEFFHTFNALVDQGKLELYSGLGLVVRKGDHLGVTDAGMPLLDALLGELVPAELVNS